MADPAQVKITGERVVSPAGRLQPDLAAPRRRLRALRAVPAARAACSTSAAASATATTCWRRGRRSASTSTPRPSPGQERETVVADMRDLPFDGRQLRLGALGPVARARPRSRAGGRRGGPGAASPTAVAVFVTPNRLTLGRPDEIIDPYHYIEFDPDELRRLCEQLLRAGRGAGAVRLGALHGALRRGARASSTGCCGLDPLRLRRLVPMLGAAAALRPHAAALPARRRPARRGDRRRRFRASRRRSSSRRSTSARSAARHGPDGCRPPS